MSVDGPIRTCNSCSHLQLLVISLELAARVARDPDEKHVLRRVAATRRMHPMPLAPTTRLDAVVIGCSTVIGWQSS
jgi:hypothetical protein